MLHRNPSAVIACYIHNISSREYAQYSHVSNDNLYNIICHLLTLFKIINDLYKIISTTIYIIYVGSYTDSNDASNQMASVLYLFSFNLWCNL